MQLEEPKPPVRSRALASPKQRNPEIQDPKKEDPHHVDEVPVEGDRGDAHVMLRRELASCRAEQDEDEQDQAAQHMQAVEPGHREERAGEGVRLQRQTASKGGDELEQLPGFESEAKDDR